MEVPRDVAVVGEAVTVIVADGWNRLTLLVALAVIGSALKSALSLPAKVTVLTIGSGSPACTVRVTKMVRLAPGAKGWLKLKLLEMLVTDGLTPAAPGCRKTPLTTILPRTLT